jgi:pyridoxal phosphate enzyme (YggS family)
VTLVAVSKGVSADRIREAAALGLTDFGENRVQEAQAKQVAMGYGLGAEDKGSEPRALSPQPVRWHFIGHLQRNKVKPAAALFQAIHSIDSEALAGALSQAAAECGARLDALVQVNISGEATKFGCQPEQAAGLALKITGSPGLRLAGLMTLAPFSEDPGASRPHFKRLRLLRDEVASALACAPGSLKLSMGMSQDFEVAIEEGADFVRIGTAIFGERH